MAIGINFNDFTTKILLNKKATSSSKATYEEVGANTVNLAGSDVWMQDDQITIDDPASAVANGVAEQHTLYTMTEDITVASQRAYYAGVGGDWISDAYGSDYQVKIYQNNGSQIFPTDSSGPFFNNKTGILSFEASTGGFSKPFKISGYRYVGKKGISTSDVVSANSSAITISVTTGGSDSPTSTRPSVLTGGNYSSEPFATIQAAMDALPDVLPNAVTINIGSGNFAGFSLQGKMARGGTSPGSGQFEINGTTGTASLTSGITGGTASSGTSRTIVKSGAGWTTNNLRGKYVSITSGAGAGQVFVIKSNTSAQLTTVAEMSPAPNGTSVFTIIESKTIINSNGPGSCGVLVDKFFGKIEINNLTVSGTTYGIVGIASEYVVLSHCYVVNTFYGIVLQDLKRSSMTQVGVLNSTTGIYVISVTTPANNEKGILVHTASDTGLYVSSASSFVVDGLSISNCSSRSLELQAVLLAAVWDLEIDGGQRGIQLENSFLSVVRCDISNTTLITMQLLQSGFHAQGSLSGSGNADYGISCDSVGSTVEIYLVPTITGSRGDASIDDTNALTWSVDFNQAGKGAVNNLTGARIARTF